jgi:hypothetical protein
MIKIIIKNDQIFRSFPPGNVRAFCWPFFLTHRPRCHLGALEERKRRNRQSKGREQKEPFREPP